MNKKTDPSIIQGYLEDSSNLTGGYADGVYLPESEAEISKALTECNAKKTPLTVSAGQTGTTGGCIPFGGWVLTTQKLNKILDLNTKEKFAIVQPGVTLEEIKNAVKKENLLYPPDPTEKNAFVGGNVATNASGGRSYRFGSTRNWIRRLRVILPSGETLNLKRRKPADRPGLKSSAGYYIKPDMDQIDLFIGAEGTLGIVSEGEIALAPALSETFDIVAFFPSEQKAVDFVIESKKAEDRAVNFFEFFDENTLKMLRPSFPNIPSGVKAAIYIEQEVIEPADKAYIDYWADLLAQYGASLDDCWLAADAKQKEGLDKFRHAIPEHINELFKRHHQIKLATDIAVPNDKFKEMFAFNNSRLNIKDSNLPAGRHGSRLFYIKFGHIGENHLHVNLLANNEEELKAAKELVLTFVRKAVELGGTISAEHGIGKIKHLYLKEMYGEAGLKEMIHIKKTFDPNIILGLNNVFPKEALTLA